MTQIQPMLTIGGGTKAVEFYQAAFGAVVAYWIEDPDGNIVARLSIDGAEFWVHDASAADGNPSPIDLGGSPVRIILVVDDPDALYTRALICGAKPHGEMVSEHGWRTGRVVDPFGHHWEMAKQLDPSA